MKKFLCLFVCLMTCLTTTVFAATNLTDIKGSDYETAVDKLVYLKIVNGYEDNTFKPKNKVTRAELSKMLVLALGKEEAVEDAKNKFLSFPDVLSSFWGYGYIKVASDEKLVTGYTDGTFNPNGNVTYAEATTMVVRALGYKEEVERSSLVWPNNYMVYADEKLELFDDIKENEIKPIPVKTKTTTEKPTPVKTKPILVEGIQQLSLFDVDVTGEKNGNGTGENKE